MYIKKGGMPIFIGLFYPSLTREKIRKMKLFRKEVILFECIKKNKLLKKPASQQ